MNYDDLIIYDKTGEMMKTDPVAEYFPLVSRKEVTALLCMMPIGYSNSDLYNEVYGFPTKHAPYYDTWRSIYCDKHATEFEKNEAIKLADSDPSYYDKILERCQSDGENLVAVGELINDERLKDKSDAELSKLANDLFDGIRRMSVYLVVPISLQNHLEEKLKSAIGEKVSDPRKLEEYFEALTVSLKDNSSYFELLSITKLAVEFKENGLSDEVKSKINDHAKKYGSIGVKYGIGEFWTSEDIITRLELLRNEQPEEKLAHVGNLPEEREERVGKVFDELNADEQFRSMVKVTRLFVYLRTYRTDVISNTFANAFPLFEEIGKRKSLSRKLVIDCTPSEIISMDFPSAEYINNRAESFICKSIEGKTYYSLGDPAKKLKEELKERAGEKDQDAGEELKGMVAFRGVVTGRAKIVLDNTDLHKIEKGDILIAAMTTPDFVPAMERAAGFVTNEGGILCHAAIISREMKKPCVIGTKFATKILKDGDLIEVDADRGLVKKVGDSENILHNVGDEEMVLTKDELKAKVLEYDWEPWLSREFGAFILSLFVGSNSREAMRKIGVDVEHKAALYENNVWQESVKAFKEMFDDIKREIDSGNSIKKISESCERYRDESKQKLKDLLNNKTKTNREKFIEAMEIIKPIYSYIWLAHDFEYYLAPIFKEKFAKYFEGDIDKFVGDLSFPVKKNSHVLLEEALLSGEDTKKLTEEFGWMKARDGFSDPYTEQELIDLVEKLKTEDRKEAPKADIPIGIMHEVDESREIVYFRTLRTDVMFELLYIARPIIKAMGEELGIEFKKMRNYSIYDLIEGNPKEYPESLIAAYYEDQSYFYDEPIIGNKEAKVDVIKGTVAFSGKVTGPVKIVDKFEEIGKVEEGDILVTHMTVPSFVMAMKKAAGFVTNEGGMTCHAAIIAREMKKPCITGTKIATKVLHDGDIVEVDAERGIVTRVVR